VQSPHAHRGAQEPAQLVGHGLDGRLAQVDVEGLAQGQKSENQKPAEEEQVILIRRNPERDLGVALEPIADREEEGQEQKQAGGEVNHKAVDDVPHVVSPCSI